MNNRRPLQQTDLQRLRTAVVVNIRSRRGRHRLDGVLRRLERGGVRIDALHRAAGSAAVSEIVSDCVRQRYGLLIVGGGDGTISAAVDHLAHTDIVMGLLPLGTGNSFARMLGITSSLSRAADIIAGGLTATVDLGLIGGDYFANVVTLGLSADIVRGTSQRLKRYLGSAAYVLTGIRVLWSHQPFRCRLTMPGGTVYTSLTHEIIIANGGGFGAGLIDPDALIDDSRLTVFTVSTLNRRRILLLWMSAMRRRPLIGGVVRFSAGEVEIEADPPQYINIDGRRGGATPVHIGLAPGALKVLVPAPRES